MDIIIWLVMGGLIGWIAGLIMGTQTQQSVLLSILVGIVGAMVGGWLAGRLPGAGSVSEGLHILHFFVPAMGAVMLLLILSVLQRSSI